MSLGERVHHLNEEVAAATAGRDRVLDATKVGALLVVIVGHSIAWEVTGGSAQNVLETRPDLAWLTWFFQVLPLFFAAGAVSNAGSLERSQSRADYWSRRVERLAGPVLVYAGFWTLLLLPLQVIWGETVTLAGLFLAQLLWFAAVYLFVVAAAPWTARWRGRPYLTLVVWLGAIVLVDAIRLNAAEALGWLNLILVWGWLHQVGYALPVLRNVRRWKLIGAAAASLAAAVAIALVGPYSSSLVSFGADDEASNLAPPTIVTTLYGLAIILLLAAAWSWLERVLTRPAPWTPIALLGSRGMGLYLWHIPIVGSAAAIAMVVGSSPDPIDWAWVLVHGTTAMAAIVGAWLLASLAAPAQRWVDGLGTEGRRNSTALAALVTFGMAIGILYASVIGFATWWGTGAMGIPGSSPVVLLVLVGLWWFRARPRMASSGPPASATE